MNKEIESSKKNMQVWRGIAIVAGVFSFIICMLLIVNYLQINRHDPVEVETINALVQRLSENPSDELLREQIRELDLLARKAYFTNQWQIRTGGLLLILGLALMVIALQVINLNKKKIPVVDTDRSDDSVLVKGKARTWISIGGAIIILTALGFAYLSHDKLGSTFRAAAVTDAEHVLPVEEEKTPIITETAVEEAEPEITESETLIIEEDESDQEEENELKVLEEDPVIEEQFEVITETKPVRQRIFPSESELRKNFPSFRGYGSNGIAYQKNIPVQWDGATGENILWKVEVPLHGYNSPIIWENKLFLTGANSGNREIYCYDKNTGALLWTAKADNIPGSPEKSPDVTEDTGQAAPTMTTDGERVYAIFANGDLIALDMEGNRVWAMNLGKPRNHYGHSSSLIMYQDRLLVQYDHGTSAKLLAFDGPTGEKLWRVDRKVKISWASPILVSTGDRMEVMLIADPYTASYDPETGEELWRVSGMSGEVGPSLVYADGMVFGCNEYAILQAIQLGDKPEVIWDDYNYLSDVPSPVAMNGYLILPTSYGVVVCYDMKTGGLLWEKEFDNGFYSSPMIVEDKVYLLDRKGVMHIFKPDKEFVFIAESALGEESVCTPAFSDGRIYIRAGNNLYCIGS